MSGSPDVWASFTHDPRRPEHAGLRAADVDREVVHQLLTEAYADGRLDRDEFDARTTEVAGARTLGELLPLMEGLVPTSVVPAMAAHAGLLAPGEIEQAAVAKWRSERRSAVGGFVSASVICWVIWAVVMLGGFPWPIFVMLGTGMNAINTHSRRDEIVAKERRRLEKKQRRALEQRDAPTDDEDEENPDQ